MDAFASSAQYNISNAHNMHIHIPTTGEKHKIFQNTRNEAQKPNEEELHKELMDIAKNHPKVTPTPRESAYHKHLKAKDAKLNSDNIKEYSYDHSWSKRHDNSDSD